MKEIKGINLYSAIVLAVIMTIGLVHGHTLLFISLDLGKGFRVWCLKFSILLILCYYVTRVLTFFFSEEVTK